MNDVAALRASLDRWACRRLLARRALAFVQFAAVLLAAMLAEFAGDRALRVGVAARGVALGLWLVLAMWAVRRWLIPRWWSRETAVELALLLERRQRLESDLVAALQFDSPGGRRWGSTELQRAVVDYVAEFAKTLRVPRGRPPRAAVGWIAVFVAVAATWISLVVVTPAHTAAFARRFLLAAARYPTHTRIEAIEVNGFAIAGSSPAKAIVGQPLELSVRCSGRLPESGEMVVHSADGRAMRMELLPTPARPYVYSARVPRLFAPVVCQITMGDAWPEPLDVATAERPQVELTAVAKPPDSAAARRSQAPPTPGATRCNVLAGSQITLELRSRNKPLDKVVLELEGRQYDFSRASVGRRHWRLSPPPLQNLRRQVNFAVTVTDVDGISPAERLAGAIHVKADRPPTVEVSASSRWVLPTARPTLNYHVTDDVAIARLQIDRELRHDGQTTPLDPIELAVSGKPAAVRASYALDLSELAVVTGDELRVTVTAADDRGQADGLKTASRPLVFRVTDQAGLLASLTQPDADPSAPADGAEPSEAEDIERPSP